MTISMRRSILSRPRSLRRPAGGPVIVRRVSQLEDDLLLIALFAAQVIGAVEHTLRGLFVAEFGVDQSELVMGAKVFRVELDGALKRRARLRVIALFAIR